MNKKVIVLLFPLLLSLTNVFANDLNVDICVYGGTSSGVMAAYTAKKMGKSVILIEPSDRIGGLTTGGLGFTDIGNPCIMMGYTYDFYKEIGLHYGKKDVHFCFEPKVALAIYQKYLKEEGVKVLYHHRVVSVKKKGSVIQYITVENALHPSKDKKIILSAKEFIDCSYEGDLMAKAGVGYTVGRESSSQYDEYYNGAILSIYHQMPDGVDPYVKPGDKSSGLLYGIQPDSMENRGSGDGHVQAYNFRITLTDNPANKIPITKPENYNPSHYELLIRMKQIQPWKQLDDVFLWSLMPNHKTDINNNGGFSTDMIGANWNYPEASYTEREKIFKAHLEYTKGFLYFVGHDPRIPSQIRTEMLRWGYPKDEYLTSDHFTPQLYIRESRRMIGRLVMTQDYCEQKKIAEDAIGWAAYGMDSHNSGRFVVNGMVKNEGDVQIKVKQPYKISYRAITPKESECSNLLVPVCLSASHICYGSIRMEPVFMVLGQSAAIAAVEAMDHCKGIVQNVDAHSVYQKLDKKS